MTTQISLLRIYTDEAAYFGDLPVADEIVHRVKEAGLAGVTVLQATAGFRRGSRAHIRHGLEDEQSLVVEIVDVESALLSFAAGLGDLPHVGLVTLEGVRVLQSAIPLGAPVDELGGSTGPADGA